MPLAHRDAYLAFMTGQGLGLLEANGFRRAGPWVVEIGRWTEVTYLFQFDSLAERERLVARFAGTADARTYGAKVAEFTNEVTTRLLVPAPFAKAAAAKPGPAAGSLPHRDELAPGVFAAGFDARSGSANCGWVALRNETLLIDVPRGIPVPEFLAMVAETTGKPARTLALTHAREGDAAIVQALREARDRARRGHARDAGVAGAGPGGLDPSTVAAPSESTELGDYTALVTFLPLDGNAGQAGAAVHLPGRSVLFGGPLIVHGPRAPLAGSDTERWVETLRRLEALAPAHVVPGFGSWGGPEVLSRHRRFLAELRRQVGYQIAQGRPRAMLGEQVKLPAEFFAWMPYDTPTAEDLDQVYRELTVPIAPFHGREPAAADPRPHALVLIGDQPHEPGHIEEGLRPVFEATGVVPHFAVDVKALSATNLAKVRLLVILRDGLQRPALDHRADFVWMTPEQQHAVVAFVESGGGFLNLHNSMGLYPAERPLSRPGRRPVHGPRPARAVPGRGRRPGPPDHPRRRRVLRGGRAAYAHL